MRPKEGDAGQYDLVAILTDNNRYQNESSSTNLRVIVLKSSEPNNKHGGQKSSNFTTSNSSDFDKDLSASISSISQRGLVEVKFS